MLELPLKDECDVCKGTGSQPGHQPEVCGKCGGKGQIVTTQQSLFGVVRNVQTCPDCSGSGKIIRYKCSNCAGTGYVKSRKKIQIAIPPGVDNGTNIRIKGKGEPGINGGEREILQLRFWWIVTLTSRDRSTIFTHQSLLHSHRQPLVERSRSTP